MQPILTTGAKGTVWSLSFLWKRKFLIITLLVILPALISTVQLSIQERNPTLPFAKLGLSLINADNNLYNLTEELKTDINKVIGYSKSEETLNEKLKYSWYFFKNIIWKIFMNVWLLIFYFNIFFKLYKIKGTRGVPSSTFSNLTYAFITLVIFQFVISLFVLIINKTTLVLEGLNIFQQIWIITKQIIPFRGVFNLCKYMLQIV